MKRYLAIRILALGFVLLALLVPVASAGWTISGADWTLPTSSIIANVNITVNEGGLFWVNNTVVANLTSVWVDNGSVLIFAATPTNSNYSFSGFDINGTLVASNPYSYVVSYPVNASSINVSASFTAIAPTPTPDLTVDDSVGLAVALGLLSLVCGVGVALYLFYLKNQDSP